MNNDLSFLSFYVRNVLRCNSPSVTCIFSEAILIRKRISSNHSDSETIWGRDWQRFAPEVTPEREDQKELGMFLRHIAQPCSLVAWVHEWDPEGWWFK